MSTAANIIRAGVFILATLLFAGNVYATPYQFTNGGGSPYTVDDEFITNNSTFLSDGFYIANEITVNWNTTHTLTGQSSIAAGGTLNILPGKTLTINNTDANEAGLTNAGTINVQYGSGWGTLSINNAAGNGLSNSGTLNVYGIVNVTNSGNQSLGILCGGSSIINVQGGNGSFQGIIFIQNTNGVGIEQDSGHLNLTARGQVKIENTGGVGMNNADTINVSNSIFRIKNTAGKGFCNGGNDRANITIDGENSEFVATRGLIIENSAGIGFVNGKIYTPWGNVEGNGSLHSINGARFSIQNADGTGLQNDSSGTVVVGDGTHASSMAFTGAGNMTNTGTITLNNGSAITRNGLPYILSNTTITDATGYTAGFTVGNNATVTWNTGTEVTGPIVVESGAALNVISALNLGTDGSVTGNVVKATLPYILNDTTITNATGYTSGFTVGNNATVNWNSSATVTGPIVVESGATFNEVQAVVFGSGASITGNGSIHGALITVDDAYFIEHDLANGFTVPARTTMNWNTTHTVSGQSTIAAGGTLNILPTKTLIIANTTDTADQSVGLINTGTINVQAPGNSGFGGTLVINNSAGGNKSSTGISNYGTLNVAGSLNITSSGADNVIGIYNCGNQSTGADNGTINIIGGSTFGGLVTIANTSGTGIQHESGYPITITYKANVVIRNSGASSFGISAIYDVDVQNSTLRIQNSDGVGISFGYGDKPVYFTISSLNSISTHGQLIIENTNGTGFLNGIMTGAGNSFSNQFGILKVVDSSSSITIQNTSGTGLNNAGRDASVVVGDGTHASSMVLTGSGNMTNTGTITLNNGSAITRNGLPYILSNTTITNATGYTAGFTVGNNATVTWNTSTEVTGPIVVESAATLSVISALNLGTGGSITGNVIKSGKPYILSNTTITNATGYTAGFTVGNNATVNWNSSATVTGPIVVESGATFNEVQAVVLGTGGTISGAVTINVDDTYFSANSLANGFTVPAGATMNWNTTQTVSGNSTIAAGGTLNILPGVTLTTTANSFMAIGINNHGTLNVQKGACLTIQASNNSNNLDNGMQNDGTVFVAGVMNIDCNNSSGFMNSNGGTVTVEGSSDDPLEGKINIISSYSPENLSSNVIGMYNDGNSLGGGVINVNNLGTLTVDSSITAGSGIINLNNININGGTLQIENSGGYGLCSGYNRSTPPAITISNSGRLIIANTSGTGISNGYVIEYGFSTGGLKSNIVAVSSGTIAVQNTGGIGLRNDSMANSVVVGDGTHASSMAFTGAGNMTNTGTITLNNGSAITRNSLPYILNNTTITNATGYTSGFTVGNNATVTWNTSTEVTGPIVVESAATLNVISSLNLGTGGSVTGNVIKSGKPYILSNTTITNATGYTAGFTVGNNATVNWNNDTAITGTVIIESGSTVNKNGHPYVVTNRTISDSNVSEYVNGFAVGSGITATWSTSTAVNGPVTIETGGTLNVSNFFNMSNRGSVTGSVTKSGKPYVLNALTIAGANPRSYTNGFTVANGVKVTWNSSAAVTGPITLEGNASEIIFTRPLILGRNGSATKNNLPYIVKNTTITNNNVGSYTNGFTIDNGVTVTWNSNIPVSGQINIQPGSSISEIQPLTLGSNGLLIKNGLPYVIQNVTVSSGNFSTYAHGFYVASGATVTWNSSTSVDGPVSVETGGFIVCSQPLNLTIGHVVKNGLPYILSNIEVTDNTYASGFTVASGRNVIWNTSTPMTGSIVIENGGNFNATQALNLGSSGTIELLGSAVFSGNTSFIKNGILYLSSSQDASSFTSGFTVPSGVTATWDTSALLTGPIVVEAGGLLHVTGSLNIGSGGSVNGPVVKNGLPYILNNITITDDNVEEILIGTSNDNGSGTISGFAVASDVILNWASSWKINGPVVVEDGGVCNLNRTILLGSNGSLTGTFFKNGLPYIVNSITIGANDNASAYEAGFTVGSGATFNWENATTINGPIVVTSGATFHSTQLNLGTSARVDASNGGTFINDAALVKNGLPYIAAATQITDSVAASAYSGGFAVASGATVTLSSNVMINGPITVEKGGTLNVSAAVSNSGNTTINGTVNVENSGTLTLTGDVTIGSRGIITEHSDNLTCPSITKNGLRYIVQDTMIDSSYAGGFIVASGATVRSNSSVALTGNIIVENGGTVLAQVTKNGKPYIINNINVTNDNASLYTNGFTVASGITVTWNTSIPVAGEVVVERGGLIRGTLIKNGLPYIVTNSFVNLNNVDYYSFGFTLAKGVSLYWAVDYAYVSGTITLEGGSTLRVPVQLSISDLINNGNITVGAQGSILQRNGSTTGNGTISQGGNSYTIQ